MNIRLILCGLVACAVLCAMSGTAAAQIFVTSLNGDNFNSGTVGEYTTSGMTINPALITGLDGPEGIAVSGGDLFVSNFDRVGKYTLSGVAINPALVTGLIGARPIAVSGANLFVGSDNPMNETSNIGKYTTSGAVLNPALIMDAAALARGIAVSGDKLFVADDVGGVVAEYTTSGATVNAVLIPVGPEGIAVSGDKLFITNFGTPGSANGTIGEYTTSGTTVNAALVSGLNNPIGIAVVTASVPDTSSTWTLLLLALTAIFGLKIMLRQPS